MAPPSSSTTANILPPKENALFKRIVRCYERKEYKNGLKFAKQILSNPKCAEHGETLAMKGLILNCMGKKDEAYEYVRRGLKNDVRSHVCWHVYGLLQRSDKKYDEAIKAYRNALKIDKENLQILRDLSLLQLQMRDLEGYKETRYLLFTLRPTQKASWITFAMANHLLQSYDTALKLLDEFRIQQEQQKSKALDNEYSELLLYHIMVYKEAKRYKEALERLQTYEKNILDKVCMLETKAELLFTLNLKDEASLVYRQLIERNSENIDYYNKLEQCLYNVSASSSSSSAADSNEVLDRRLRFYDEMCNSYPRSLAPKRLPLTFTHGAKFLSYLKPYAKNMLRKGVPPLFVSLRSLYKDNNKVVLIQNLFISFAESLEKFGRFPEESEKSSKESPTTILWVYYFLALHYDYVKNYDQTLLYLDKATEHTPTLIELLTARAKVYKHSGDNREAARLMDEAQSLDTADRYVNSKCAKYMLRAGLVSEAEQMCGKFTREGSSPTDNLNEMQCMWFETQCAQTYYELNNLGEALKKCHEVERHFIDIIEDQFDFHTYCVRRMTLCAYVRMIRLEDTLRKHKWYFKAAKVAISIYVRLHDKPYDENENVDGMISNEHKSSEVKKQRRKEKKQQVKKEQLILLSKNVALKKDNKDNNKDSSSVNNQLANNSNSTSGTASATTNTQQQQGSQKPVKKEEQDNEEPKKEPLDPKILVKTPTPLDEALKFLRPLLQLKSRQIETYLLGFEVFYRRNKLLMMLHCLKQAILIDSTNPAIADCKERFKKYMSTNKYDSSILEIVLEETEDIFCGENASNLRIEE